MKIQTGYCAANYTRTDRYSPELCGPIRADDETARQDADSGNYDGVRFIHVDGYLYVDAQDQP